MSYAAERFGWGYHEIMFETPASVIALLRRNEGVKANKIYPLSAMEDDDDGNKETHS